MRFLVAMMLACLVVAGCDDSGDKEAIRELTQEVKKLRQEAQRQRGVPVTLKVPAGYLTIQQAIDASFDGDIIEIAAGIYNEHSLKSNGKAITIQGTLNGDGSLATTIDAQQGSSVFEFDSGETSGTVIKDLVITGGTGADLGGWTYGGGIYCFYSNPTISGCEISGNTSEYGGGIALVNNSNPTITECTISGNTASHDGGGIYVYFPGYRISSWGQFKSLVNPETGSVNDSSPGSPEPVTIMSNKIVAIIAPMSGPNNSDKPRPAYVEIDSSNREYFLDELTAMGVKYIDYSTTNVNNIFDGNSSFGVSNLILAETIICGNDPDQIHGDWIDEGGNTITENHYQ